VVKITSSPLRLKRTEWVDKQRMQRSVSLDDLDNIDAAEEELVQPDTPKIEIRRCSTEASKTSHTVMVV
jgi:hypothetical protein